MPYFKVDDKLHSHRKTMRASVPAMGLWVLAASWCMDQQTDGWVPDYAATRLDRDAEQHAAELVAAGYWHPETRGSDEGWLFHEWDEWQHSTEYLNERRRRNAARMRTKRANEEAADLQKRPVRTHAADTAQTVPGDDAHSVEHSNHNHNHNNPSPSRKREDATEAAGAEFADFWQQYPRKVGKAAAAKAYTKARKSTDAEAITYGLANAVDVWRATSTEAKFIPHPATWLNAGRWDDEVPLPDMPGQGQSRATLAQCDGRACPGSRHEWTDASNRYVCMGDA